MADEQRAIRENQAFVNGSYDRKREDGGVFVYLHDNPDVHLSYHTNLSKTEEAQKWDTKKWEALQTHIGQHMMILQAMTKMQAQAGAQGNQPKPGGQQVMSANPNEATMEQEQGVPTPEAQAQQGGIPAA